MTNKSFSVVIGGSSCGHKHRTQQAANRCLRMLASWARNDRTSVDWTKAKVIDNKTIDILVDAYDGK